MPELKQVKVRFLRDFTYKVGASKTPKGKWKDINKTVKKGTKMEIAEAAAIRLTSNPDDIVIERL